MCAIRVDDQASIDGVLTQVSTTPSAARVTLRDDDGLHREINVDRGTADRAISHLGEPVRFFGFGTWRRDDRGTWALEEFWPAGFRVLRGGNLRDAIDRMRGL